uniref:Hydrogenase n=1 Tax=Fundidesulfovibrio putealis TaxID=270496 RepID=A0A7C4EI25_9BACT
MSATFLAETQLNDWLGALSAAHAVLVPVREGDSSVFRPYAPGVTPYLARQADAPPKGAVFPACESLVAFRYAKNPDNPDNTTLEVRETIDAKPTVVLGGRPCDARGFTVFDRVYVTQAVRDANYAARRENTLFVTQVCTRPDNTCFCHCVGSSPSDPAGSDVLLTPVDGGWVVEAVSERGQALMAAAPLPEAAQAAQAVAVGVRDAALAALGPAWSAEEAPAKLIEKFDDAAFWEKVSAKCISCGACTYLCPTCYCFTITDERTGMHGERLRSWDTCMSYQFTLEASGHNPRPTKAHRLKNRVGHKFSYYPQIHAGNIACCGCGRCIRLCPVSVDIREIVRLAVETPTTVPGKP